MTSSNGDIFRVTGLWQRNSPVTGHFSSQRPLTWSFDVFFNLHLNKRLNKQSRHQWFEQLNNGHINSWAISWSLQILQVQEFRTILTVLLSIYLDIPHLKLGAEYSALVELGFEMFYLVRYVLYTNVQLRIQLNIIIREPTYHTFNKSEKWPLSSLNEVFMCR